MKRDCAEIVLAGRTDEAELRSLLRDQPLPGWVSLSFEREPDYFAAAPIEGQRHAVLLAREPAKNGVKGRVVGIWGRGVRRAFVDGEERWLGYVGQFRAVRQWQRGFRAYRLLRDGFDQVRRSLHRPDELPYDVTSILSDNHSARRILTAGLRGMPRYQWLGGFHTLVYRSRRGRAGDAVGQVQRGSAVGLSAIARCLQRNHRRYQFAPVWDEAALLGAGLAAEDFLVLSARGRITACLAIWDQRAVKQVVVRGYRRPICLLRPLINLAAPLLGYPSLPSQGAVLRQGWLSHLACDHDEPAALRVLLPAALARARELGLDQLMLGLADGHPLLPLARAIRHHLDYRSDIYLIRWPGYASEDDIRDDWLGSRPLLLELATL